MLPTEPPADPGLPALDRRTLFRGGLLGLGMAATPLSAQLASPTGSPAANRRPTECCCGPATLPRRTLR